MRCFISSQQLRRPSLWQKLTLIQTASCLMKTKRSEFLLETEQLSKKSPVTLVQKLKNFPAKTCVGGARRRDNANPFNTQMSWLKTDRKVVFDVAVAVYWIQNNMYPEWFLHLPTITCTMQDNKTTYMYSRPTPTVGHVHSSSLAPEYGTHCHNKPSTQTLYICFEKD